MTYDALDDFAGPGGWDEGARLIGLRTIGIEHDHDACRTAVAAGHARIRADVDTYPSHPFRGISGVIESPPCTLFSSAGSGVGKLVLDVLADGIVRIFRGDDPDAVRDRTRAAIYPVTLAEAEAKNAKREPAKRWTRDQVEAKARRDAVVAALVLEPARRIVELSPEWAAFEQVPEVLPLWKVYAHELRARGYSVFALILNAADYGVPQTRRRAVLGASRTRTIGPPEPTHTEHGHGDDLFGVGRLSWVTMAEGLGWGATGRPAPTIHAGKTGDGRVWGSDGHGSAAALLRERESGGWGYTDRPAPTVCAGPNGKQTGAEWGSSNVREAMYAAQGGPAWAYKRPATTIVGSFGADVVAAPGYRLEESRQNAPDSIRVEVHEAGILQSFRPDYPWQGARTRQYEQVGNAVPPLLAAHVLAAVTGREAPR